MNPQHLQLLGPDVLVEVLEDLGVRSGWVVADLLRENALFRTDGGALSTPLKRPSDAFRNLAVGTIAERVFKAQFLEPLTSHGFRVAEYAARGDNRDFGLLKDGLELPINVKVASTIFRNALRVVLLEPEDCIPIGSYKAISAADRVPDLVYVDLVDFTLREKVDHFIDTLEGPLEVGWHLLSWFGGRGARKAQDQYIETLFARHGAELDALAPDGAAFRVISAKRVLAILRQHPKRVPGLGVKNAGTGGFVAEVNVHVSVREETVPWSQVSDVCRNEGIGVVLQRIRRTSEFVLSDPLI